MTSREIKRLTAIATLWGNGSQLVTRSGWKGKRVYAVLKEEWNDIREELRRGKIKIHEVTAN